MNEWFDVPDSIGVWFGVRVIVQMVVWFFVMTTIIKSWKASNILLEVAAASIVVSALVMAGSADELLSVFAFLFGINPSGW